MTYEQRILRGAAVVAIALEAILLIIGLVELSGSRGATSSLASGVAALVIGGPVFSSFA